MPGVLAGGILRDGRGACPSEEFEHQQVRRMEAGHGDVSQIFVALGDVTADQDAQLFDRYSQFHGSFVLGVLRLSGFDSGRCLVHDPIRILSGKYGRPNQADCLDETLVHLTDLSTSGMDLFRRGLVSGGATLEVGTDSCLKRTHPYFVRRRKS